MTHPKIGLLIYTQSWPVDESRSQIIFETVQVLVNFFIMLIYTSLLVHGVVGLLLNLFTHTCSSRHLYPEPGGGWIILGGAHTAFY